MVGAVAQELMQQVAIGPVQLDPVEACSFGVFCRLAELRDDAGKLADIESAWGYQLGPAVAGEGLALDWQGRGGDRKGAIVKIGM